jgi:NAD(P)-dependent dehydrogenase (short-subunit alcohol dehydrogenase family)
MSRWTTTQIPDLSGKVALVTGANSGLGYWTALHLGSHGAHVVLACRSLDKAEEARASLAKAAPKASFELLALDLAHLDAVRASAQSFCTKHPRLDILCNNAGLALPPLGRTRDGFESQFGANFLGHFAYTGLLLDTIRATPGARVVHVASVAHKSGRIDYEDPNFEQRRYVAWTAYAQSKLANLVFALELQRRFAKHGIDAISVAAHPGYAATNIRASNPLGGTKFGRKVVSFGDRLLGQSAEHGALPQLYAAVAPGVKGGAYFGPRGPMEFKGPPGPARIKARAKNEMAGSHLWSLAERLTGVHYLG